MSRLHQPDHRAEPIRGHAQNRRSSRQHEGCHHPSNRLLEPIMRILLSLFMSTCLLAADKPEMIWNDQGPTAIRIHGTELPLRDQFNIWKMWFASGKILSVKSEKAASRNVDASRHRLEWTYDWGSVEHRFRIVDDHLVIEVTIHNRGQEDITGFAMYSILGVGGLQVPAMRESSYGVDEPCIVPMVGAKGGMALSIPPDAGVYGIEIASDPKQDLATIRLTANNDRIIVDNVRSDGSIASGASRTWRAEVRFFPEGTTKEEMLGPAIAAWREAFPPQMSWGDRRPIGRLFLGGGLPRREALDRLKSLPGDLPDVTADAAVQAAIRKKIDGGIATARAMDAQGIILWDLEGTTFPHATTYIGDPRMIRVLNPQMDQIIDGIMADMKANGLRVGITLRPSRVIYDEQKDDAKHSYGATAGPFEELDDKIVYAKERWGATLFYIDTNFFWRPYEGTWKSGRIAPQTWAALAEKHPDCLFIPEFGGAADYRSCAVYGEADMGSYGMPAMARQLYGESFRVVVVEDADPYENFERFVGTVENGNALMTFCYAMTANVVAIQRIRHQAALMASARGKPLPPINASLAQSPEDVAVAALRAVAEGPATLDPAQEGVLRDLALGAGQHSWHLRRAALQALQWAPGDHEEARPLLNLLLDQASGLRPEARKLLQRSGVQAHGLLWEALEAQAKDLKGRGASQAIDQIGQVLRLLQRDGDGHRLLGIIAAIPADNGLARRRDLIALLGGIGGPAVESDLIGFIAEEPLMEAAATGLAAINTDTARAKVEEVIKALKAKGQHVQAQRLQHAIRR